MALKNLIPLFSTDKLAEVKQFYVAHFGFKTTFESDGFLGLKSTDSPSSELGFMVPEGDAPTNAPCCTLCMEVDDVDKEHDRVVGLGLPVVQPLKDNAWGDRSFVIADPIGTALYIYHPIAPGPEFAKYFKE